MCMYLPGSLKMIVKVLDFSAIFVASAIEAKFNLYNRFSPPSFAHIIYGFDCTCVFQKTN